MSPLHGSLPRDTFPHWTNQTAWVILAPGSPSHSDRTAGAGNVPSG
jgi:hypothetical protein